MWRIFRWKTAALPPSVYWGRRVGIWQGYTLLPGFVDIHIHGRGGGDFSDGTVSSMDRISASLAKCGVTAFCGTTMTLPREKLTDILVTARGYMGKEAGAACWA